MRKVVENRQNWQQLRNVAQSWHALVSMFAQFLLALRKVLQFCAILNQVCALFL